MRSAFQRLFSHSKRYDGQLQKFFELVLWNERQLRCAPGVREQGFGFRHVLSPNYEQIGPLALAQAGLLQPLEIKFKRPRIVIWGHATWPVGDSPELRRFAHGLYDAPLAPDALRPAHQEVTAAQPTWIEQEISPWKRGTRRQDIRHVACRDAEFALEGAQSGSGMHWWLGRFAVYRIRQSGRGSY